ncbi:hypothetical protein [Streptomyces sp. NBC_00878]|uniref:hypothetical protein n=1 Tax=Streptomyces sp. NBC_00878 TaxID=2975854 RepID=UPI0022507939|nr:hypothetical protein [Streptomyces sp. NBC_00878]MCX4911182.1 hypothetical protein [Streptomyces sp. NBC_00878]
MNDDELLARLRAADPALTSSAPPPDINRLVEAAVNTETAPQSEKTTDGITNHPAKATAGRSRRGLLTLAATAALLLLGGGIAGGIMLNDDNGHPSPSASKSASAPLSLTLASDAGRGKCMEPTPDTLRGYPTLFEGTVTSVEGSSVIFQVDLWLRGGDSETVRLQSGDPDISETLTFLAGEHYIVAATKDGTVPMCGANGASDETIKQFRQAFGK